MCLSLKYQVIFPYPHNIPIQHSLSWKSAIQRPPSCIQTPVLCFCPSPSNLEIIFHNWPPTTYCLPVTLHPCLPDWLVYYALHSSWWLTDCLVSVTGFLLFSNILGSFGTPSGCLSLSIFPGHHLPLLWMSSLEKGEEIFCKINPYLLWVHTYGGKTHF